MSYHIPVGLFLVICLALMGWECGDPPTSAPPPVTGDLRATALDTTVIDSIQVEIDDLPFGMHRNPCTITGIVIGVHRLFVTDRGASSSATMVEVFRGRRSDVMLTLLSQGPYPGQAAPNFAARTITNDSISLQQLRDKIVLLVFFEHT